VSALIVRLADDETLVDIDGDRYVIPIGPLTLRRNELVSDPPRPEELTNAIGIVVDHLDDMVREVPSAAEPDQVAVTGELAIAVSAVEFGGTPSWPFTLQRAAAEEVFRTVATEAAAERALNPGLPPDAVDTIVAACCIVVGLMRKLHLDQIDIVADPAAAAGKKP
jgi:exopolyphosphatase/guanosine-5'-triphosphate,3'-diphosphate pyrophosphatase